MTIKDAPKTTRGWNDVDEVTKPQREKEIGRRLSLFPRARPGPRGGRRGLAGAHPHSIGELPAARRQRFESDYGLSPYDANVLVEQGQDVADYYRRRRPGHRRIQAGEQLDPAGRAPDDQGEEADASPSFRFARTSWPSLINRVKRGELNTNQGREVLGKMIETGEPAETIIDQRRLPDGLRTATQSPLRSTPRSPPIPRPSRT